MFCKTWYCQKYHKIHRKTPAPEFFFKKETLAQVFFREFCEISKNTFSIEYLRTTVSVFRNRDMRISLFWIILFQFCQINGLFSLLLLNANIYVTKVLNVFGERSCPLGLRLGREQVNTFHKNSSSRSQMFFKTDVLEIFANFTVKHLCWSLFYILR